MFDKKGWIITVDAPRPSDPEIIGFEVIRVLLGRNDLSIPARFFIFLFSSPFLKHGLLPILLIT